MRRLWSERKARRILLARILLVGLPSALSAYLLLGLAPLLGQEAGWARLSSLLPYGGILPWYAATVLAGLLGEDFERPVMTWLLEQSLGFRRLSAQDVTELERMSEGNPLLFELELQLLRAGRSLAGLGRSEVIADRVARVFASLASAGIDDHRMLAQQALACGTLAGPECPRAPVNEAFGRDLPAAAIMARAFPAATGIDLARVLPSVLPTPVGDAFIAAVIAKSEPEQTAARIVATGWQANLDAMVRALIRIGAQEGVLAEAMLASLPAPVLEDPAQRLGILLALMQAAARRAAPPLRIVALLKRLIGIGRLEIGAGELGQLVAVAERLCAEPDTRGAPLMLIGAVLAKSDFEHGPGEDSLARALRAVENLLALVVPASRRDCAMPREQLDFFEACLVPIFDRIGDGAADPATAGLVTETVLGRLNDQSSKLFMEGDGEGNASGAAWILSGFFRGTGSRVPGAIGVFFRHIDSNEPAAWRSEIIGLARESEVPLLRRLHDVLVFHHLLHERVGSHAMRSLFPAEFSVAAAEALLTRQRGDPAFARACAEMLFDRAYADRLDPKACAVAAVEMDRLGAAFGSDQTIQEKWAAIWRINAFARSGDPHSCAKAVQRIEAIAARTPDSRVMRHERAHGWRCLAWALQGWPAAARRAAEIVEVLATGFRDDRALTSECIDAWTAVLAAQVVAAGGETSAAAPPKADPAEVPARFGARLRAVAAMRHDPLRRVEELAARFATDPALAIFKADAQRLQAELHLNAGPGGHVTAKALLDGGGRRPAMAGTAWRPPYPKLHPAGPDHLFRFARRGDAA